MEEIERLISSLEVEEIRKGLELATQAGVEIDMEMYNKLFRHLYKFHTKIKRYEELTSEEKIRDINRQEVMTFFFKERGLDIPVKGISKFQNLKKVKIVCSKFGLQYSRCILGEVLKLKLLEDFTLVNYPFKYIEFDFKNLVNLKVIDLRENNLEEIPLGIAKLPNLKKIFISGNPFCRQEEEMRKLRRSLLHTVIET